MRISDAAAYRIGQLTERLVLLQVQAREAIVERREILARYGVAEAEVTVVTEPGGPFPVGTVLESQTGQPIAERRALERVEGLRDLEITPKEHENGQAEGA